MNKYILGILKKMAKNPNIRQTEEWTKSKMQMVSILTTKIQKVKGDHHLINVDVNDSHMEIHSWVSWFSTRDPPRFFDQVGHQTTNASIGNKHFFSK